MQREVAVKRLMLPIDAKEVASNWEQVESMTYLARSKICEIFGGKS